MRRRAPEKRHAQNRYVKSVWNLWSDMSWPWRVLFSPVYGIQAMILCLKGVPIQYLILHDDDYEPEVKGMMMCPQCHEPRNRTVEVTFRVEGESGDE